MPKIQPDVKNRVIIAAKEMLAKQSNADFTMRDIARSCDIALGTIYNYYPSKAELLVDIVAQLWNNCFTQLRQIDNPDFYISVKEFYDVYKDALHSFMQNLMNGLSSLNKEGKKLSGAMNAQYTLTLKNILVDIIVKHKDQLDNEVILFFGKENLAEFILNHFTGMIANHQSEYGQVEYFIRKLLSK